MRGDIDKALEDGRSARNAGHPEQAVEHYALAATLARSRNDDRALAHALRHVSDIARDLGDVERALEASTEAVALCRALRSAPLELANALRVNALALQAIGDDAAAMPAWDEARGLYAAVEVRAGVDECERHLHRTGSSSEDA